MADVKFLAAFFLSSLLSFGSSLPEYCGRDANNVQETIALPKVAGFDLKQVSVVIRWVGAELAVLQKKNVLQDLVWKKKILASKEHMYLNARGLPKDKLTWFLYSVLKFEQFTKLSKSFIVHILDFSHEA